MHEDLIKGFYQLHAPTPTFIPIHDIVQYKAGRIRRTMQIVTGRSVPGNEYYARIPLFCG